MVDDHLAAIFPAPLAVAALLNETIWTLQCWESRLIEFPAQVYIICHVSPPF